VELGVQAKAFGKYKMAMVAEVRRRLEKGLLQISKKYGHNKQLLDQLFAYEFAPSNVETGGVSEKTAKINDDYIDALDLALYPLKPGSVVLGGRATEDDGITGMYSNPDNIYKKRYSMQRLPGWL